MFYILEPEVAGGLGDGTVMDTSVHPPRVQQLHYQFDGWLGDDLVASFPCFVVTARLRTAIEHSGFTGAAFAPVRVTTSDTFREMYPGTALPVWAWLQVRGTAGADDLD